jgi:hypothetical protein
VWWRPDRVQASGSAAASERAVAGSEAYGTAWPEWCTRPLFQRRCPFLLVDVFPPSPATDPTSLTLTPQLLACCACANMHPQLTGPISRGVHCCAFALSLLIRMSLNILRIFLFFQIKKRRFHTCTLLFFFNAKSSQLLDVRL